MIDLRYHIVSIMAVFLALGLGILLGSSVVSDPLSAQLNEDLVEARSQRDTARRERGEALADAQVFEERLVDVAPWVLNASLDGARFVLVSDGRDDALQDHVRDSLVAAGGEPFGRIVLESKLALPEATDRDELIAAVTSIVPACEEDGPTDACFEAESEDLSGEAMEVLGGRFGDGVGRVVLDALIDGGFLSAPERPDGDWPTSETIVVMLASGRATNAEPLPGSLAFARAVSVDVPTLVATETPERPSLVTDLRDATGSSELLSTFDVASEDTDPGGIGVVTALIAATEGRGGHFGIEGDRFIAPAPGPG